ncbi:MAG TPA: di-heme oxidoredictase family protein [Polyangiaceae bacterium]|nr:di-heme oxidoredictase family protein [Polyangiaceae bacterium]
MPTSGPSIRPASLSPLCVAFALALGACSGEDPNVTQQQPAPAATADAVDVPIRGLDVEWISEFNDGDLAFGTPLREADGLGPLYTRASCAACHDTGARGPGLVQKMVLVEDDGVTPRPDQSALAFGFTVHPLTAGGGHSPILPPKDPGVKVTDRLGPPVIGRGYMEAIADSEIERVAQEQAAAGGDVHGRVNYVSYASEPNSELRFHQHAPGDRVIGRFGLKARVATLDDFTADAFQGDMGITSPLRPTEFPNPDGLTDDMKPGIDVGFESVNRRANYVRLLAIPARRTQATAEALFASTGCASCHVPSLRTRADYPVAALADVDAPIFSDLLLHNMGAELADGLPRNSVDGDAGSFEWRTAPLIGLRFNRSYLHDGRAKTIEQAILLHRGEGSEANASIDAFETLTASDRQNLVSFVSAL